MIKQLARPYIYTRLLITDKPHTHFVLCEHVIYALMHTLQEMPLPLVKLTEICRLILRPVVQVSGSLAPAYYYVNNMELPEITSSLVSSQPAPGIARDNYLMPWC